MKKNVIYIMLLALLYTPAMGSDVKQLDKRLFLKKVFNFSKDSSWKFRGKKPCIVFFYSDNCYYCQKMEPTIEELAKIYKNKISVYKVNISIEKEVGMAFAIKGTPTTFFCAMNGRAGFARGLRSKKNMERHIKTFLLKKKSD
jgi:thioredoxin 1